jgi:hypothetical protein
MWIFLSKSYFDKYALVGTAKSTPGGFSSSSPKRITRMSRFKMGTVQKTV